MKTHVVYFINLYYAPDERHFPTYLLKGEFDVKDGLSDEKIMELAKKHAEAEHKWNISDPAFRSMEFESVQVVRRIF